MTTPQPPSAPQDARNLAADTSGHPQAANEALSDPLDNPLSPAQGMRPDGSLDPEHSANRPLLDQEDRNASRTADWPTHVARELLQAADEHIESCLSMLDALVPGAAAIYRDVWQQVRPQPTCDCPPEWHAWECPLTPIWAQLVAERAWNPNAALRAEEIATAMGWPDYFEVNPTPYTLDSLTAIHCWRCRRMHTLGSCWR